MKKGHEFKVEIFTTLLFLVIVIITIKEIGFTGVHERVFTLVTIIELPLVYFGSWYARKLTYQLIREWKNENK